MARYIRQRPPRWFQPVCLVAAAWGLFCSFFFLRHLLFGPAAMGPPTPADIRAFEALPRWYGPVYGLAVTTTTLGGFALMARAAGARMLFAVSLAALLVQFAWLLLGTPLLGLKGGAALVFPAFLIAVAALETWFTHKARRRGWIS